MTYPNPRRRTDVTREAYAVMRREGTSARALFHNMDTACDYAARLNSETPDRPWQVYPWIIPHNTFEVED